MSRVLLHLLFLLTVASSCAQKKSNITIAPHYSAKPIVLSINKELDEISGLSFDGSDYSAVYAISDDKGSLYKISLTDGKIISAIKFDKQKNFEDLVIIGDTCYVLNSNGNISSFNYKTVDAKHILVHHNPESGKNEFEILYAGESTSRLILICKSCERDNKKKVTTYYYDIAQGKFSVGPYTLDATKILKRASIEKNHFKPSAAAIHPISGQVYIVSSVNKLLVITDTRGAIKGVYPLNGKLFKQPEGIAFTASGDMLISNESAGNGPANILIYKYSP
jgi:uncharacterized protein YjiK